MSPVLRFFRYTKYRIGCQIDRLKPYVRSRRGVGKPIVIVPYTGYGNATLLRLRGRVLSGRLATASLPGDSRWRNLLNMWLRVWTAEMPGVRVIGSFRTARCETVSDIEGYFQIDLATEDASYSDGIRQVTIRAEDSTRSIPVTETVGEVVVPGPEARFGVISDIDDTIIHTGVANKFRFLMNLAFSNAHTRALYADIPSFYRALQAGISGDDQNPFFYISGSPYNLYDMLVEIFRLHRLPKGHVALKNLGVGAVGDSMIDQVEFKTAHIRCLFEMYPTLPFVLIGDTTESDAAIYAEVAERFPGRVPIIYLREVGDAVESRYHFDWSSTRAALSRVGTELASLNVIDEAFAVAERRGLIRSPSAGIEEV